MHGDKVDGPPLPPRKRHPLLVTPVGRDRSHTITSMSSGSVVLNMQRASFSSTANYDLLFSRLDAKDGQTTSSASIASGEGAGLTVDGTTQLRRQFEAIKHKLQAESYGHSHLELESDPDRPSIIDWDFWTQVVDDYSALARNNPLDLSLAIASGVPQQLRGVIWQIVASSKSNSLEELYSSIVSENSPHESAIRTDLSQPPFSSLENPEPLFRVTKAYSLFDPEIGYTEGMLFVAAPLLHCMPEMEAFCLIVKLMKEYGLRDFFLTELTGLHLRLYQFDRILEDTLPDVHIHLSRQGVRSSMYSSQWFLTLFAYKFPMHTVLRIYDVVLTEGIESLLKFAVGLMRRNAPKILTLDFDSLLVFLKGHVFDFYMVDSELAENSSSKASSVRNISGAAGEETVQYRVNDFVADAYDIKVLPFTLQKYINEYKELHRQERERVEEVEELRNTNGSLKQRIKRLEATVASLTSEHVQVAINLAEERIKSGNLLTENEDLTATKQVLENEVSVKLADLGDNAADEVRILNPIK